MPKWLKYVLVVPAIMDAVKAARKKDLVGTGKAAQEALDAYEATKTRRPRA